MENFEQIHPELQAELKAITEDGKIFQDELESLKARFQSETSVEIKKLAYEYLEQQIISTILEIVSKDHDTFLHREVHAERKSIQIDDGYFSDTDLLSSTVIIGIVDIYNEAFGEEISIQEFGTQLSERIENNRSWSKTDFYSISQIAIEVYKESPSPETVNTLVFTYGLTQDEDLGEFIRGLNVVKDIFVDLESQSRIFEREFYYAENLLGEEIYVFKDQEGNFRPAFGGALRENIDLTKSFSDLHGRGQVNSLVSGIMIDFETGKNVFSSYDAKEYDREDHYNGKSDKNYMFAQWWDYGFLEGASESDFHWDGSGYDFHHIDFSSSRSNFYIPMMNSDNIIVFVNPAGDVQLEEMNIKEFETRFGYTFFEDIEGGGKRTLRPVSDGGETFIVGIDGSTYFKGMGLTHIGGDTYNIGERNYHIDDPQKFINAHKGEHAVLVNYAEEILFEDLQLDSLSDAINSEGEIYYIASKSGREFLISESGDKVFDTGENLSFNSWIPTYIHDGIVYLVAYDSQNRAMLVGTNGAKGDKANSAFSGPGDFHEGWYYRFHYVENGGHNHQGGSGMIVLGGDEYLPGDELNHMEEETLHIHL